MELILATNNRHKADEIQAVLAPLGIVITTLQDYPDIPPIAETGETFPENALLKATAVARLTNKMVLADDSGLVVPALDGAPGVHSARYAKEGATDQDNNERLLEQLKDVTERDAYFITVMCLLSTVGKPMYVEGRLHGTIARTYKGENGFGYDPLFQLPDGRHLAELSLAEKNAISHRAKALAKVLELLAS